MKTTLGDVISAAYAKYPLPDVARARELRDAVMRALDDLDARVSKLEQQQRQRTPDGVDTSAATTTMQQ